MGDRELFKKIIERRDCARKRIFPAQSLLSIILKYVLICLLSEGAACIFFTFVITIKGAVSI